MRVFSLMMAGVALIAAPAMAAAPAKKAPAKAVAASSSAAQPPQEVQHAMLYLKVLISGLQSDKVEQPVKGALVGCIYNNSLSKITESMDKVIAENSAQISRDNPTQLLTAMAAVCGYKPEGAAAATPKPGATPDSR